MKALYYGDNLQVLRDNIATESVDLIYLDPPFNSKTTYNVGCQGESGRDRMRGRTAACSQKETWRACFTIVDLKSCSPNISIGGNLSLRVSP